MSWREGAILAPLLGRIVFRGVYPKPVLERMEPSVSALVSHIEDHSDFVEPGVAAGDDATSDAASDATSDADDASDRSEEHTSELQSLMRISYAVFCLKKKKKKQA